MNVWCNKYKYQIVNIVDVNNFSFQIEENIVLVGFMADQQNVAQTATKTH